jgi:Co/Zn/Cd efflux system component
MMTTVPIFCDCIKIIMEATPTEFDVEQLYNDIIKLKRVEEIHDFHCWTLAGGKYVMTCHIRSAFGDEAINDINKICKSPQYGIFHSTI